MPMPELAGITVVVTRPTHQARGLCEGIRHAGGEAITFPAIEIGPPADPRALQLQLDGLANYGLAVFVSANAAHYTLDALGERPWPQTLPVAAVGRTTAVALQGHGLDVVHIAPVPYHSEALLGLPALQNLQDRHIIIFRGNGGREYLAQTLRQRGAQVEYAESYQRRIPHSDPGTLYRAWGERRKMLMVVTSNEGLHNVCKMIGSEYRQQLLATRLVVVSERAAQLAEALGFCHPARIASAASDEAILGAIEIGARTKT
jgi:uroporphyrinogen-III synthase